MGEDTEREEEFQADRSASYRLLIERQWADIHHSRVQEWSAVGVVIGAHIGILQVLHMIKDLSFWISFSWIVVMGACLGVLFAIIGVLMTMRHRYLMFVKIGWIYQAEWHLGLVETPENPTGIIPKDTMMAERREWEGLCWPRFLSTSFFTLCFYSLLLILDVLTAIAFCLGKA